MKSKTNTSVLPFFRHYNKVLGSMICAMMGAWQVSQPLSAANITWNGESDTNFNWQDAANWDAGIPTIADAVILPFLIPNPGSLSSDPSILTLGAGSEANSVLFKNNYTLSGGTLTLGAQGLSADLGTLSIIDSTISGSDGLRKTGGGSIRLNNTGNNYTGATTISNGTLIISGAGALGSETSPISIQVNNTTPLNANLLGFGAGSLVLDGSNGGFALTRNINFEGRGPIGDRGAAILSLGNNSLSGVLTSAVSPLPLAPTATFRNSRINSVNGMLTLDGTLSVGGVAGTVNTGTFTSLGGVNTAGVGDFNLTGILTGTGSIEKTGAGILYLNPSSTSGFTGTVRVGGASTGQQSSVRVSQLTVGGTSIFGANTAGNASGAIDMNGGVLEFRNEGNLDFNSLSSGKNVYLRANSTFYTGPGAGGQGINGITTLGTFRVVSNTTGTFNSRNGYGMTFQAWTQESSDNANTITNNMGGTLTFTGDAWNNGEASAARTLTIAGGGNTVIAGNINTSGAGLKALGKNDAGTLTINGTATTLNAGIAIGGGELAIRDFRSVNNNTGVIAINSAALIIGTNQAATTAGLVTSKIINLSGTTGGATLYADQSLASPVVFNSNLVSTGVGAKTLTLGGVSQQDNVINGSITNAGSSFTSNAALATGGTVISFADTTGMAIGQQVAGTGIGTGTTITAITPTSITLSRPTIGDRVATDAVSASTGTGAAISLSKIGSGTWALAGTNTFTGNITISQGNLKLRANAATSTIVDNTVDIVFDANSVFAGGTLEFVGQNSANNIETLDVLTPTNGANTLRLTPGTSGTASLVFNSLGTVGDGATVNIVGSSGGSTVTLTGQTGLNANPRLFFNGADFAFAGAGGVMRAPVYGTDSDFAAGSASALTATQNNLMTGSFATNSITIDTLKIGGSHTLTLNAAQTLTIRTGAANTDGAILQTGGSGVITGGTGITTGGSGSLTFYVNGGSDTLTVESALTNGTTGGITKSGAGTLILSGNNLQTGTTTINEGTLRLSGSGRLSGANATATIRQGATLDLNGVSTGTAIGQFNNNGVVTNSSATAATLQVGNNNGTGDSRGIIQDGVGVVNVTKIGTGAQNWLGLSTYTGVTTIGGTGLVTVDYLADIGQDSGIGRGVATSNATNAASLVFNGSTGGLGYRGDRFTGLLNIEDVSVSTNRLFTLAATATGARLSSTVGLNGAIVWSNTAAIVNITTANAILTFEGDSTGDNTFNPQLVNSSVSGVTLGVTKTGTGQWNLGNSNNTYTGITTVSNGILALNQEGALPGVSPLVLGTTTTTGVLQTSGTFARDLSTTPTVGFGTITWGGTTGGGGFAAHSTPLTVTLNGGAGLTWGSGGFVGTGGTQSLIFGSGSALADVTFTNPINLGASQRTITVNENGNTGADYATMSGVLSGAGGGIFKAGSGILRLTGANTYTGVTSVDGGTLVVSSLGSSTGAATSSVGASGVVMNDSNAIVLGNASTTGGLLQYVGPGETSDRKIRLRGTTAGNQIHADGSGALILTNVAHDTTETGNKTLSLRGNNTAGNMITSQLSNNGAGVLSVTIDGSATWILTNSGNNYTGTTTVTGGALGIGHNSAIPAALSISNGNVFAYGGDRTLTNTLNLGNNATSAFLGDYNLTFNGTNNLAAGANNLNVYNSIAEGKALTFNGLVANSLTGTRAWAIDGQGETVINGNFSTTTAFGVNITKSGNGILTLGTNGATSNWNQTGNALDLDRGMLRFTANNAIPTTATSTGLTISPEAATFDTATVNLNGTTQTINALTATSDGTVIIDNTSATAAAFRFGANNTTVNFGSGVGNYSIQNTGDGALDIVKLGNTSVTFGTGIPVGNKGAIASEGGGTFIIAGAVSAATGLRAVGASTLSLTGSFVNPHLVSSVEVGGGSTLALLNGAGSAMNNLTNLSLGNTGTGTVNLNLNVGDLNAAGDSLNTDTLGLLTGGTLNLGNTITFNMTDAGLNPGQTYTLLNLADGGLTAFGTANLIQGATPGGFTSMTWSVTNNQVQLTTGNLIVGDIFWRGLTNTTWNGNANNWSTDKAGLTPAASIPGQGNTVRFAWDGVGATALTTTLEQNFKVNALVFESGTTTPTSVTINPGSVTAARLEVAPQASTDGIAIATGGPASVTLGSNLRLGANQTWNVADLGSVLTISGSLLAERNVTKTGLGRVVLGAAADTSFNTGRTSVFTVNAGNLELTNAGALGSTANNNLASVVVNGGGFYFNGAASTLPHAITLAGGSISAGANGQTYSGAINISANSTINMADNNGPITAAAARNVTLSGIVSGSGDLTIESNNAVTSGNQTSGTFLISNAGNTWNGNVAFNRGTMTLGSAFSPSFVANQVKFNNFGRLIIQGANGTTLTRTGDLNYLAGAVGEFQVDNAAGTPTLDYVVDQSGAINIGSAGTGATVRVWLADDFSKVIFSGPVTLGGNSSISAGGAAARLLTISGVIGDSGSGYGLAINDDAGAWGAVNATVRLTGLNTFTGNLSLDSGILEFDTVTNVSGGASALGNGTAINTTNAATLRFIGTSPQSTNRPINIAGGALTLSANGSTPDDSITYTGAINVGPTGDGSQLVLSGAAGRAGFITGGISQTGDTADMTVNGGTWTLQTGTSRVGDDVNLTGATTVLNINSGLFQVRDDFTVTAGAVLNLNNTGVLSFNTTTLSADASLLINNGGIVNLGANNAVVATEFDRLFIAQSAGGALATLNMSNFALTTSRLVLGERLADRTGQIDGTGLLTVTGGDVDLFKGIINANLATTGTTALEKFGPGTVSLRGDNSGLASTGATTIQEGTLELDYTVSNTVKIRAASALDMQGGTLTLLGNASAPTAQTVASFTLGNGGSNVMTLTSSGQDLVMNLNAITRAINAQDGTIRFNLPTGIQSATNGITTDTTNSVGSGANAILGGWALVNDGTGVFFARNATNAADGNIVAANTTLQDNLGSWGAGENISDATGFTGTFVNSYINSLRMNAAAGSSINVTASRVLGINSGGLLITSNVTGNPSILGGTLFSGAQASNVPEIIVTHDGTGIFEISSSIRTNSVFTKSGAGILRLTGNNTYTGSTDILHGILQVNGGNAIGDTSIVTLDDNRDSTLQLLANETIGRLQGGRRNDNSDYGLVDLGVYNLTINQSANTNYFGRFTGSGNIILNSGNTGNLNYNGQSSTNLFTGSVIVNGGLFQLSGAAARLGSATAFTINSGANFLIDNNDDNAPNDRIADTTPFTLNSATGAFNQQSMPRGLAIRTDNDGNESETIGTIAFNSGVNYASLETGSGTNSRADIISAGWTRANSATLNVRGRNLGGTTAPVSQFKVVDANDATMIASNVGGSGVVGGTAKNIAILPWAIGENLTAALADGNMGNTFVSYVDNRGLVPLNLTNEYATFSTAASGDNVRESLGADLTGLTSNTINSLIINNTAFAGLDVTGNGVGQTLAINSGALLFTVTGGVASTAYDTTLGGFDGGITVGATNEYVIHVVNPSAVTTTSTLSATIASPLTSVADITKSGRGTLVLSGNNTAGGGARRTTLNEGVLQVANLGNIGGNSGALFFAGGALRLATGFNEDLSTRTITFLNGGGTLDTNGNDLTLANTLGSGVGGFTKTGAGNLTLNAAASFSGGTTVAGGTLTVGVSNATGVGGNLTIGGGATLALGTSSISHALVSTSGASPQITGTGTINATGGYVFNHTGDTSVSAVLAGAGGLFKAQANLLTLAGANTYTGTTEIQAGTLSFNTIGNVGGGASALGAPATVEAGIIRMGISTTAATLQYTGAGNSSNRIIGMQGTTGGVTLDADGSGALLLTGGVRFENAGNKTLTLRGSSASGIVNQIGQLSELGGVLTLNKADANIWQINADNTYTGATQIDEGTLMIGANNALPVTTAVRLGTGTTAGVLDLNGFNQVIGSLVVQTNSNTVNNVIIVDSGNTLTINGPISIGVNANESDTNLIANGGGNILVNSNNGNFLIGAATVDNENRVDVDFSGIDNFTANLGTGTLRLGDPNTGVGNSSSTFRLAVNNNITAASIRIGDSTGGSNLHTLTLGSGSNALNVDTFNIGSAGAGIRSSGAVVFDSADTTGTLTVRAANGTGRATLNMVNTTGSTAADMAATLDLSGHTADLLVGTLTMATRSNGTGLATAILSFNQGTLDVTTLNMGTRTGVGTGGASATLNLGDSAALGIPTATIGTLTMAVNTSAGGTVTADLNVTGGNVTLGTGTGTAINMANAGTGRTSTSNINLTGGTVTLAGNVIRQGGAGTETATVTLNGATLNMGGFSIGTSAAPITFAVQSGTLSNLAQLNGGGALTKSTAGVLVMGNGNAYTGGTNVTSGTVTLANTSGSATGSGAFTSAASTLVTGAGSILASLNNNITFGGSVNVGNSLDIAGSQISLTTSGTGTTSLNGDIFFDLFGGYDSGSLNASTTNDMLVVSGTNGFSIGAGSNLRVTSSVAPDNSWVAGTSWKLFDWGNLTGGVTGTFTNLPTLDGNFTNLPDLSSFNLSWDVSQLYTLGTISIVPEPGRALLVWLGLMLCFFRRRRQGF